MQLIWTTQKYSRHLHLSNFAADGFLFLSFSSKFDFTLLRHRMNRMTCEQDIYILFLATKQTLRTRLRVVMTSSMSGYVTPPGYPFTPVFADVRASHTIHVHKHQRVMLSFKQQSAFLLSAFSSSTGLVTLSKINPNAAAKIVWSQRGVLNTPAAVYNSSINIKLETQTISVSFSICFSFHVYPALPQQLQGGLFNCSVAHYASFKDHLHCNLKQECEGREDEGGHCPFSSPACDGKMAVGGSKCYSLHVSNNKISWLEAQKLCQAKSRQLVTLRFKEEVRIFLKMLRIASRVQHAYVGLLMDKNVPNLYRHTWRWDHASIAYFAHGVRANHHQQLGCVARLSVELILRSVSIHHPLLASYVCEHDQLKISLHSGLRETEPKGNKVIGHASSSQGKYAVRQALTVCPGGYLTHDFLKCDLQAACLVQRHELTCPLNNSAGQGKHPRREHVPMFVCDDFIHTIPYSLVCNFVTDCLGGSDETFCRHERNVCDPSQYRCANGQCVSLGESTATVVCDRVSDCKDESDEASCRLFKFRFKPITASPPALIDFDQSYVMTATALDSTDVCPNTHFKCLGSLFYCVPVYVRCNHYYDCPLREDELHCKNYFCPGFYRCKGTSVCVHVTHLCDGVAQCPGRDDELLCGFVCPLQCQCQGWSFVCRQSFPADSFAQLRYLDAIAIH